MAVPFVASNEFLNPATALDLTASPKLALTNSSTFTVASNLATVAANEVSTGGYARIDLTVLSNSVQPGGDYKLIYNLAQFTPSGASVTFDRVVLVIGSNWAGYWDYGSTTIANGQTYPFRGLTIQKTDQGVLVNGSNGLPAYTLTSASFVHPAAIGNTVSATVGSTSFMAVGAYIFINDGTNASEYKVSAIGSTTNVTIERTSSDISGGTTVDAGALVVPTGKNASGNTIDISADTDWYVSTSGTTENDGLTVGTPITIDEAFARIGRLNVVYDADTSVVLTLNIANGTYTHYNQCIFNPTSYRSITIKMTGSTWAGTLSDPLVIFSNLLIIKNADFDIKNIKFGSLIIQNSSQTFIQNVAATKVDVNESYLYAFGWWKFAFTSNAFLIQNNSYFELDIATAEATGGSLSYSQGFIQLRYNAVIAIDSAPSTITGTFTGSRIKYADALTSVEYGTSFIPSLPGNTTDNYPDYITESSNSFLLKHPAINAQTGTTYILTLADDGQVVTMDNGGANTVTIPTNASVAFPVGSQIKCSQIGAGITSYTGDTGVTVNGTSGGTYASPAQYSIVTLIKIATDTWLAN
jgi:hypothetical protein